MFDPDNPARKSKQYENNDNFCIRTPFFDDLGLVGITTLSSTTSSIKTS
jgi:hypothetical protein